jgi:hypothetical protein
MGGVANVMETLKFPVAGGTPSSVAETPTLYDPALRAVASATLITPVVASIANPLPLVSEVTMNVYI